MKPRVPSAVLAATISASVGIKSWGTPNRSVSSAGCGCKVGVGGAASVQPAINNPLQSMTSHQQFMSSSPHAARLCDPLAQVKCHVFAFYSNVIQGAWVFQLSYDAGTNSLCGKADGVTWPCSLS